MSSNNDLILSLCMFSFSHQATLTTFVVFDCGQTCFCFCHRILYFVGFSFVYLCFSCICHVFVSLWCFCQPVVILCVTVIECMSDSAGFYLCSCCYIFLHLPVHLWSCSVSVFVCLCVLFLPFLHCLCQFCVSSVYLF